MTNLLLVDDEPVLVHALSRLLRQAAYTIHTAEDAQEAQRLLKSRSIDLIVSDQTMPGMSGTTLLRWVAEYFPDTVRILLTGWATIGSLEETNNIPHVDRLFVKPCDYDQLRSAIKEELENCRAKSH